MRLRKFRVRAFRCIHDSGEISVADLAAFVGKNESGKTTILQALLLLNREESVSDLDLCDEMSDELKSEITLVEGQFQLTPAETAMIKERFPQVPEIKTMRLFRTNKVHDVQYDFGDIVISEEPQQDAVSWNGLSQQVQLFLDTIPNHIREKMDAGFFEGRAPASKADFDAGMKHFNETVRRIAIHEEEVVGEWLLIYKDPRNQYEKLTQGVSERDRLVEYIGRDLHPRFVYFSDYKKIYGNINLNEFMREQSGPRTDSVEYVEEFDKAETVRNLFYLAELDLHALRASNDSPSTLIKLLNTASNRLTKRLNPTWKGDPIRVDLRYNPGNIMSLVISDVHRDGTITNMGLLSRRAEGFKWTFSFIVNFAAETQRAELKEAILLLDEPARNLHPTQQMGIADLLRDLAGSNQVLYATHSPFMIFDYNPGNLLAVELDRRLHLSRIFSDYWNADDSTLTPIMYGLSRGLVQSMTDRWIGVNSRPIIIVETMSDAMYLNAFDKFLEDPNISMNPLNVIPSYSKDAVLPLATFYKNHDYKTLVLLDDSAESHHIASRLTRNGFSPNQVIFYEVSGKKLKTIEDYMDPADYMYAVNQTYEVKLRAEGYTPLSPELVGDGGIVGSLQGIWKDHHDRGWGKFDPMEITRYVCNKIATGSTNFLGENTRDNFRMLYRTIAERIRLHHEHQD